MDAKHKILFKQKNTNEGRIVPLAPPSGISLFFNDCVEPNA
jgi:hypothetical protein